MFFFVFRCYFLLTGFSFTRPVRCRWLVGVGSFWCGRCSLSDVRRWFVAWLWWPLRCPGMDWPLWIGRRGCAVSVRPSYCQRCPDSPTLNTPGSLPYRWPLRCPVWPLVGRCGSWCGWVVDVSGCGFHRRGCSLDVGWCGRRGDVAAGWSVWPVLCRGRCQMCAAWLSPW